jgi:hypothetical protein
MPGLVVKPIWLLMMKCTVPAGAVTPEARQTEAFRHHALACKGRIPVDQQRHHRLSRCRGFQLMSCLARALPITTGLTISR